MHRSAAMTRKPQIALFQQIARSRTNRGKRPLPCVVKTPLGHIFQAAEVIGKSLAEIKSLAVDVDTCRPPVSALKPQISLGRQARRLIKSDRHAHLPFVLMNPSGHILRANEVLGRSAAEINALARQLDAFRSGGGPSKPFPLAELGEAREIRNGQGSWEVVLGVGAAKLEAAGIDLAYLLGRNAWAIKNDHGMLTNIDREEAEKVVESLNRELGLGVTLPDERAGELVSVKFANELLARGIFWFHSQAGRRVVGNAFIRGVDPLAHMPWGGLLVVRSAYRA